MPDRGSQIAALAPALLLLAGACAEGGDSNGVAQKHDAGSPENAIVRLDDRGGEQNYADSPTNDAMPDDSADPGLARMTPYQRRAYDRGFRDCRAGRYDPDRHPESYRIGCAAAHDGNGGGRPQG